MKSKFGICSEICFTAPLEGDVARNYAGVDLFKQEYFEFDMDDYQNVLNDTIEYIIRK